MGGMGKTTLARQVYNDQAVEHFDPKKWVCVSDDFDVLRISKTIFKSIALPPSSDLKDKDLNQVQVQLKEAIAGGRFLFVLDDVWGKNYALWKTMISPYVAGAPVSKIILTTCNKDVALTVGSAQYYELKLLCDDDCWFVLMKHALFENKDFVTERRQMIREKVVEKWRGLPLATKTLGGLLRSKERHDEWKDILNSAIWDLPNESEIPPALRLSYHHLPSHLKRCFAYCAIVPKGYKFGENQLLWLWMAEGLIQQPKDTNKQMEDLDHEYFRSLLSMSIFQQSSSNRSKFLMHDLINDLAQWIMRDNNY